jgi:hypothetical protein
MNANLEMRVKERKKQARSRNIPENATYVAKSLGSKAGARYSFSRDSVNIIINVEGDNDRGHNYQHVTVEYAGNVVFQFDDKNDIIGSYVPGEWEGVITAALGEAEAESKRKQQERARISRDNEEKELARKFGL